MFVIGLVVLGIASGVAVRQNRTANFESRRGEHEAPPFAPEGDAAPRRFRLHLDVHTAGVRLLPVAAGEPIVVDADYDPRTHVLGQNREQQDGADVLTVSLRPSGSPLMALLRLKLGGRPAMLRIALPRDVPLEIAGHLVRTFAVMELGGLSVSATDFDVDQGGIKVSFIEPLARPMESFRIIGDKGSLSVVGLGNASPRETVLLQHIGAVDVDLRGAWTRDADVRLLSGAAGGSLWLPDNVRISGLDEQLGIRLDDDPELPRPTLNLSITERMGRIVVMN
jgi:hypothetical protein